LEGKDIEKDKAVKSHCEIFEAKFMLASMLCLLDVDFFLLLTPPSLEIHKYALVLLRCPTGVLSPVSFRDKILEMVNGGETEPGCFGVELTQRKPHAWSEDFVERTRRGGHALNPV